MNLKASTSHIRLLVSIIGCSFVCNICKYKLFLGVQTGCENNHIYVKINQSVEITSPNYPLNYGPSENCWWIIASPPNTRIALIFNYFATENCCDFLKVIHTFSFFNHYFLSI